MVGCSWLDGDAAFPGNAAARSVLRERLRSTFLQNKPAKMRALDFLNLIPGGVNGQY
jgi:hypothetical protein